MKLNFSLEEGGKTDNLERGQKNFEEEVKSFQWQIDRGDDWMAWHGTTDLLCIPFIYLFIYPSLFLSLSLCRPLTLELPNFKIVGFTFQRV